MQCVPNLSTTLLPSLGMSDMFLRSSLRNESEEVRHAVRPQLFEGHLISFEV